MKQQSTIEVAADIELRAYGLSKRDSTQYALCTALLISILQDVSYDDLESLASGDEDALSAFADRKELGSFVYEHVLDTFQSVAQSELKERDEGGKDAWDTEIELRAIQGAI